MGLDATAGSAAIEGPIAVVLKRSNGHGMSVIFYVTFHHNRGVKSSLMRIHLHHILLVTESMHANRNE